MTLLKKIKEITTRETAARCPICKQMYKYPKGGYGEIYIPSTCGRFECEFEHQHPELNKVRR